MKSRSMQFNFGDKREVYLLDESALSVTEKESMQERKRSIGPRMKYGHANFVHFALIQTNRSAFEEKYKILFLIVTS